MRGGLLGEIPRSKLIQLEALSCFSHDTQNTFVNTVSVCSHMNFLLAKELTRQVLFGSVSTLSLPGLQLHIHMTKCYRPKLG